MVKRVLGNAITRCSGEREVRAGLSGVVATRGTPHFPSTSRFICILPHFKPFFKVHQLNMNLFASTSTLHHQPSKPNETKPNPPPDTSRRGALPLRQPLPCATWEAPQALPTQQPLGSSETRRAQVRPGAGPPLLDLDHRAQGSPCPQKPRAGSHALLTLEQVFSVPGEGKHLPLSTGLRVTRRSSVRRTQRAGPAPHGRHSPLVPRPWACRWAHYMLDAHSERTSDTWVLDSHAPSHLLKRV